VVPAAGIGTRMQSLIPKQYLKIGSVGVLEATLIKLSYLKMPIVVALSAKDTLFSKINLPDGASITTVVGGKNRRDSVLNALTSLKNIAKKDDWILVHDAARPLVKLKDLDLLVCMNPAALKTNINSLKAGHTVIVDTDSFTKKNLEKESKS